MNKKPDDLMDWFAVFLNLNLVECEGNMVDYLDAYHRQHKLAEIWCQENCEGDFWDGCDPAIKPPFVGGTVGIFYFEKETDAAHFKLRWG